MGKRVITALVLVSIAGFVAFKGGWWMWSWVLLVALLTVYELCSMLKKNGQTPLDIAGYIAVCGIMVSAIHPVTASLWLSWPVITVSSLVLGWCGLELVTKKVYFFSNRWISTLRVIVFVGATFPFIYLLRTGSQGMAHFLFSLFIVWTCDTCALFGGKWLGKTPLSPLSPKKTWEGSLIGALFCVLVAGVITQLFHLPVLPYLSLALFIAIISQIGDLHESLIKRHFQVKDSSNILPGHGGIYDRADSTLFVSPLAFYFFNL
jgi:phosphatidate cytidylyltransferase